MNKIALGKQHRKFFPKNDNPFDLASCRNAIFDACTKAASGMIHAGIGVTYLNNFHSALNLPQISHNAVLLHCGCLSLNPFIEFRIRNNSSSSDVLYIQASISISPK